MAIRRSNVLIGLVVFWALISIASFAGAQQDSSESVRKVKNRVTPAYPELARAMHVKGNVRLEVVVAANGNIKSVSVVGGHPVLAQAAQRAVEKWKWAPAAHESTEAIELRFNPD